MSIAMPFLGSLVGVGTIVLIYYLTWSSGHLPDNIATPPISLLGCKSPEHEAYQVGFTLTGLLLFWCVHIWKRAFYPHFKGDYPFASSGSLFGAYLAVIGVIGQGIVTLESDFFERVERGDTMSAQSICHQLIAGCFFLGAAMHCYATCYICFVGGGVAVYSALGKRAKFTCLVASLVAWPIAEALHPAVTGNIEKRAVAVGGVAQYVTVGAYILFFGSYSLDLLAQKERMRGSSKKD
jgi:hypothetical protein